MTLVSKGIIPLRFARLVVYITELLAKCILAQTRGSTLTALCQKRKFTISFSCNYLYILGIAYTMRTLDLIVYPRNGAGNLKKYQYDV
jgi:hypothetical protein